MQSGNKKLKRNKSLPAKGANKIFGRLLKAHLSEKELFENRYIPEPNSGCWLWLLTGPNGYGYFRYKKTQRFAHRASWEIHNGKIPDGKLICHKCDVRSCVNPNHLFLGTHLDNNRDMMIKKRHKILKKEKKINSEIAFKIYNEKGFHKNIAEKYNVSRSLVSQIKRGEIWQDATKNKF